MAQEKTLAMKLLEGKKIPYEVVVYPNHMRDAEEIAAVLGLPAANLAVIPDSSSPVNYRLILGADYQPCFSPEGLSH